MASTSFYIPDDLLAELKQRNAPVSRIARKALEEWLAKENHNDDPMDTLRVIDSAVDQLREQFEKAIEDAKRPAPASRTRTPRPRGGGPTANKTRRVS